MSHERRSRAEQPPLSEIGCLVPPSPELEEKIRATQNALRSGKPLPASGTPNYLDLKAYTIIKSRSPATRAATFVARRVARAPVIGTRQALVLLVDFPDQAATQNQQHFIDMLFSTGTYPTGSLRDFYREASYGKLTMAGTVAGSGGPTIGWFRAPRPKTYYTNGNNGFGAYPQNAQRLVEEIVDIANGVVNFSTFDNDGDGTVDALVIIAAGQGAEVTGNPDDIWSHQWAISPKTVDGVQVSRYFMAPEDGRVGVMSHELGHLLLGAPDLYDTDYSSRGTGRWDLMAGGSWNNGGDTPAHPVAWVKASVGWLDPVVVTSGTQDVTIPPYATNPVAYRLPVDGNASSPEYFLVSNRQQAGFDAFLPGSGCCIEHVDERQNNNTDETHYLVDIEQADGTQDLNKNVNSGDATDVFPNGAGPGALTDTTTPNSKTYAGTNSGISITNIQRSGSDILARLSAPAGGPTWTYNCKVLQTFASHHSQNAWALLDGIGWRRINPGAPDGVTNMFDSFCHAVASGRLVHVNVDASLIHIMYLT